MKNINIIWAIMLFVAISACDIVEPPYRKGGEVDPNDTTKIDSTKRKVLLEDFTGFRCGNCPEATHVAELISEQFPGRVIVLANHAGPLAVPTPNRKYEFRTAETVELANFYGLIATPYGTINRKEYEGQKLLAPTAWGGYVAEQLNIDADMKITLDAGYNSSTSEISLNAKLDYLKQGNTNHFVAVYIMEDSVVQYQQDDRIPGIHIEDYVHNHVMRGSFNGTWGVPVADAPVNAGSSINLPYTFKIPAGKDWRPAKLSLVVFVHDNTTKEVLQVEKVKLIE